jgi:hypothetical protein
MEIDLSAAHEASSPQEGSSAVDIQLITANETITTLQSIIEGIEEELTAAQEQLQTISVSIQVSH